MTYEIRFLKMLSIIHQGSILLAFHPFGRIQITIIGSNEKMTLVSFQHFMRGQKNQATTNTYQLLLSLRTNMTWRMTDLTTTNYGSHGNNNAHNETGCCCKRMDQVQCPELAGLHSPHNSQTNRRSSAVALPQSETELKKCWNQPNAPMELWKKNNAPCV